MLPKQVVTREMLLADGISSRKLSSMCISLALFPTPFKKIYYVPTPEERKATIIDNPMMALTKAIAAYLNTKNFYYSCRTAEEHLGISWRPSGEIHIVNEKISRKIALAARISRNEGKETYRTARIARILFLYGSLLIFHRAKSIKGAKTKATPYGTFATRMQIKKDKKKFGESKAKGTLKAV